MSEVRGIDSSGVMMRGGTWGVLLRADRPGSCAQQVAQAPLGRVHHLGRGLQTLVDILTTWRRKEKPKKIQDKVLECRFEFFSVVFLVAV